jgi:hypothetical protein
VNFHASFEVNNPAKLDSDAIEESVDSWQYTSYSTCPTWVCKCPETDDYQKKITVQPVETIM